MMMSTLKVGQIRLGGIIKPCLFIIKREIYLF